MSSLESPFAILTFLAAPAILTNASTVLALGTSNRLARAADRARLLSTMLLSVTAETGAQAAVSTLQSKDFDHAIARARLLVKALRHFYLAAGSFAAGTCVSLVGATAGMFDMSPMVRLGLGLSILSTLIGVGALVIGAFILVGETRLALLVLADEQAAVESHRESLMKART